MKAAAYSRYGPPSVLEYGDQPKPSLKGRFDVLVQVKAAAVNPVDAKIRSGNLKVLMAAKFPVITGMDFSGVIAEKGAAVTAFDVGDEVFGTLDILKGSCAEFAVIDSSKGLIAKKPSTLTFQEAAAFGIAAATAWVALTSHGRVSRSVSCAAAKDAPGVLVIGASGGCGHFAVMFAKALGCNVTAVCSGRNAEWVSQCGAATVIDYTAGPLPDLLKASGQQAGSLHAVLDFVGGEEYYNNTLPFLKRGGAYVTAVGPAEHIGSTPVTVSFMASTVGKLLWRQVFGTTKYSMVTSLGSGALFREMAELAVQGGVRPRIAAEYPLEKASAAHEAIETHRTAGRLVVVVS